MRIQRLDLAKGQIAFHREVYGIAGVTVPVQLTKGKILEKAAYELQEFFGYLMRKYAL